jgi:hypothetical protein
VRYHGMEGVTVPKPSKKLIEGVEHTSDISTAQPEVKRRESALDFYRVPA